MTTGRERGLLWRVTSLVPRRMLNADEHHRAPLLWLLAPYLLGMVGASAGVGSASPLVIGVATLLGGAAMVVSFARWRRRDLGWAVLLATAAGLGGLARMHHTLDPGGATERWAGMPRREATLEVEMQRLFNASDDARRLGIAKVVHAASPIRDLIGQRVYLAVDAVKRGGSQMIPTEGLRVRGLLRRLDPATTTRDGFEAYLVNAGVGFVLERAEVIAVTQAPSRLASFFHHASGRFETILRQGLPVGHPATGVYVAMFLGRKSELSEAQKESYLRSGTMHLFAISGLHIAVIAGCLYTLLTVVRIPPRIAAAVGLTALWIFVETTGGTPSARRALLMVAFVWASGSLRRPGNPLAALVAAALFVLLWDPLALLSASFQLSYAVVAALLLYGLPLRNRWHAWWNPWRDIPEAEWNWWQRQIFTRGRNVLTLAAISCAATLISTPLSLAYFAIASPGAILSNLVLVPVTSGAIASGFASLVCGLAGATPVSTVFNHAGALILSGVDTGARVAAAVPGMFFEGRFDAGWMAPTIELVMLTVLVIGYAWGWSRLPGRWWTPPAVLVTLVAFLVTPQPPGQESSTMKSAYELAMERLNKSDPGANPTLTPEQKAQLAEIDRVYQGKIAEREIFLNQRLAEARAAGQAEEFEKIRQQTVSERARLEEDREDEKNKVRRAAGGKS